MDFNLYLRMITSIITGDIINSRKSSRPEVWLTTLKEILNLYGTEPENWEIYRGDSFQLEIAEPQESLFAALLLKANIKQIKNLNVRMAIGIGEKTYTAEKITESNGPVFFNSGTCYEGLKARTLAIKSPWPEIDNQINMLIDLASLTMDSWGTATAKIVKMAMMNPHKTQKELARMLNKKSQSTISDGLKRAGYEEISRMEKYYRRLINSKL